MTKHDDDDRDYEVGYGKPPKATRFKKGQSGNPKGRPKGSKNVGTILEETFFRMIRIAENGCAREIPILHAILLQVVNGAAKGEQRHIDRALKLLPMVRDSRAVALAGDDGTVPAAPRGDRAVLEALAEMFGSDPDQLFASVQGESEDAGTGS